MRAILSNNNKCINVRILHLRYSYQWFIVKTEDVIEVATMLGSCSGVVLFSCIAS